MPQSEAIAAMESCKLSIDVAGDGVVVTRCVLSTGLYRRWNRVGSMRGFN